MQQKSIAHRSVRLDIEKFDDKWLGLRAVRVAIRTVNQKSFPRISRFVSDGSVA